MIGGLLVETKSTR